MRIFALILIAALASCGSTQPVRVSVLQQCPVAELQPPRCPSAQILRGPQGDFVRAEDWQICSAIAGAWHDAWKDCVETIQP